MKKILIIRLDGLGDTLLTLPLLDGLKAGWPDCEITYMASHRGAPVFLADNRVHHLWTYELSALSKEEKRSLGERIRAEAFDVVFCLNEKFWPAIWTWQSSAPMRLGFDPGWMQPPKALLRRLTLTHRLYNPNDPAQKSIHEVERYAALATLAGCPDATGPMRVSLSDEAKEWGKQELRMLDLPNHVVPVCLHLSAKWISEGWSSQTCIAVARSILDKFPAVFLFVTAGPSEDFLFKNAEIVLPTDRFHLFTDLELSQWAALMGQCHALVSMDTGAVHLAAAVNLPVVAVFPELNFVHASSRWSPWQVPNRIIHRPAPDAQDYFFAELCSALEALL